MTLELKKFNMREITFKPDENKGPVIVMIGRRDTGKSFLYLFKNSCIKCLNVLLYTHTVNNWVSRIQSLSSYRYRGIEYGRQQNKST